MSVQCPESFSASNKIEHEEKVHPPSDFRVFLSQLVAIIVKNLITLDLAMSLGYGSIVIAALLDSKSELHFTAEQASWFGSLPYFTYPVGSLFSGLFFEPFGRRPTMLIVNFPVFIFWFICWRATAVWELMLASVLCGLGAGFTTPNVTYAGEICQPKWRGVLTSLTGLVLIFGYTSIYGIGAITDWQTTALIGMMVPVVAFVTILLIPESPIWLLCQGRSEDAAKALSWLRGWTSPEMVKEELQILSAYTKSEHDNSSNSTDSFLQKCTKKLQIDALWDRKTLFPLIITMIIFFFLQASVTFVTRPYIVVIMDEFQSPIDPHQSAVITATAGILGNIACTIFVRYLGKRRLLMFSQVICSTLTLGIAIYEFMPVAKDQFGWLPVTLYILLCFSWNSGIGPIPFMFLAEIFPIHGRTLCTGLAMVFYYLNGFSLIKTYYNIHMNYGLKGLFTTYAVISSIGCIILYIIVPETEGYTFDEIDQKLQDRCKRIKLFSCRRHVFKVNN